MDRGAWGAAVHGWGRKESDTTEQLSTAQGHHLKSESVMMRVPSSPWFAASLAVGPQFCFQSWGVGVLGRGLQSKQVCPCASVQRGQAGEGEPGRTLPFPRALLRCSCRGQGSASPPPPWYSWTEVVPRQEKNGGDWDSLTSKAHCRGPFFSRGPLFSGSVRLFVTPWTAARQVSLYTHVHTHTHTHTHACTHARAQTHPQHHRQEVWREGNWRQEERKASVFSSQYLARPLGQLSFA